MAEAADLYLAFLAEQLRLLTDALSNHQLSEIELIAHRCAGSCATYGMDPLVEPMAAMERDAREGRLPDPSLATAARAACAVIESALRPLAARRVPAH